MKEKIFSYSATLTLMLLFFFVSFQCLLLLTEHVSSKKKQELSIKNPKSKQQFHLYY